MRPFVILALGLILLAGPLPAWHWGGTAVVAKTATAAVYVYEKDSHAVPPGVTVGLNRLNRERQILATLVEADATDGDGDVPDQYRAAVEAAKAKGLPALVVLSGSTVLSIVKAPTDADAVVRAVP